MLFGCLGGAKMTTFRGPYVKLIFDQQTTNFLLKHGPQNGPSIFIVCLMLLWTSVFMILLQKNDSPKRYLFSNL